jgi:hypothetical protein
MLRPKGRTQLRNHDGSPRRRRLPPTRPRSEQPYPDWQAGNTIPLGRDKSPRVVEVRSASDPDEDPVQVVKSA